MEFLPWRRRPKPAASPFGNPAFSGLTEAGAVRVGLSDAASSSASHVSNAGVVETAARFDGTMQRFRDEKATDDGLLRQQLHNRVKRCSGCGKPCAYTYTTCNSCSAPLPEEIIETDNIFAAFVYGVARGPNFPYSIAIRLQTPEIIVFDDPLGLCPCHFCVIPTNFWAQNWAVLARLPKQGLALVNALDEAAWSCLEQQFLSNEAWCARFLRGPPPKNAAARAALRKHVVAGFNVPPSQSWLHLQYFLMPWLPSQYRPFLEDKAMPHGRWFPLAYVQQVLALNRPLDVTDETPIADVRKHFDQQVSYDQAHSRELERIRVSHEALANWAPGQFTTVVMADGTLVEGEPLPAGFENGRALIEADKKALHSNGPVKTYYRYAHGARLPEFGRLHRLSMTDFGCRRAAGAGMGVGTGAEVGVFRLVRVSLVQSHDVTSHQMPPSADEFEALLVGGDSPCFTGAAEAGLACTAAQRALLPTLITCFNNALNAQARFLIVCRFMVEAAALEAAAVQSVDQCMSGAVTRYDMHTVPGCSWAYYAEDYPRGATAHAMTLAVGVLRWATVVAKLSQVEVEGEFGSFAERDALLGERLAAEGYAAADWGHTS